jgi:hypothetical protein
MVTFQRFVYISYICCLSIGCNKESIPKRYSFLQVKFIDDLYPISIEQIDALWTPAQKTATLTANSYRLERFRLYLNALSDTGYYPRPNIHNIYFTDGLNFDADSLNSGYIHINYLDSNTVSGDFQVSLHDDFNGSENKIIIGNFGINVQ